MSRSAFTPTGPANLRNLYVNWQHGTPPLATGRFGGIWALPYDNGVSKTFSLARGYFRMEVSPNTSYTIAIEKSSPASTFSGIVLATLTIAPGAHEAVTTTFGTTVSSGDLVAVFYTLIGSVTGGDSVTTITLEGQSTS